MGCQMCCFSTSPEEGEDLHLLNNLNLNEKLEAKCDFDSPGLLKVSKKDSIKVISKKEDTGWYLAKNEATGEEGFINQQYITYTNSLHNEDWYYHDVSRIEVESKLLTAEEPAGTFLIRPSKDQKFGFVLSVKFGSSIDTHCVKHYRIYSKLSDRTFHISEQLPFRSLAKLVENYTNNECGLGQRLFRPCLKHTTPKLHDLSPIYSINWEINEEELDLGDELGKGQFGVVYSGTWNKSTKVAIKLMKKSVAQSNQEFMTEISMMKRCRHKNLVLLYGVCTNHDPIYLVEEFVENGTLLQHLRRYDKLKLEILIFMAYEIANGMEYIESRKIIHRDLAARNILLDSDNHIKIADFGLSRVVDKEGIYNVTTQRPIPVKWTAPEAILQQRYSSMSDVWSYGIVMMEIFSKGCEPYEDIENKQLLEKLQNGYRMPRPPSMPIHVYDMVFKCWHDNPNKRPKFKRLKYFFEEYNTV